MHGWEGGGNRKQIRHMWSVPSVTSGVAAVADSKGGGGGGGSAPASSFFKDVRKINIGDCALFKPPIDCPPFIGVIRSLRPDKDNNLQLGVNWLYRPADVKLLKGVALEAAPNEVFYSFHRDETPAASLLHPCKVAFLPKGVELPSGVSSLVCRRVYDTTNKRLWWLTDRDYSADQQEEVDQLLHRTQLEMHATVQQQQGGRSPKQVNSPMSTSQSKHSPDSMQNSNSTLSSQARGKKRERSDQVSDPVKRERSSKAHDVDSGVLRSEAMLKAEIAKITERGGLVDFEGVERLVQLMQPDKSDRKIDLTCRSLLAGVIAATDKDDCLNQFVQLRGLPVLDEWLQEVHKGKVGNSSSPRDHDRSVEDFLLVLLRALDRVPVNLNALQMCNIGKSVNHLRTHRNSEIQKKARSLVDTWKKRVEAEMNINDSKSGTSQAVAWSARTRQEVSHGGIRHTGGSSDNAMKNSIAQLSSSKSNPTKLVQGEDVAKSPSPSPSSVNVKLPSLPPSTNAILRDGQLKTSEAPQSATRDDKSCSSSPSHTNSQCSSDHAKNVGPSGKEDTRSSNSGSTSLNKSSSNASRHRKSTNGLQGIAVAQRESGSSRNSSLTKTSAPEKSSLPQITCENTVDAPVSEGNNHKLIVKISNRGRSPAQNVNGGSVEDPLSTNSRASSPVLPEKRSQSDRISKEKSDGYRNNTTSDVHNESWQSNDLKDGVIGCDVGDGSPAVASGDETGKLTDVTKVVLSSKNEVKSRKSLDSSLSSINALIDSCVKYSEGNAMLAGDDVGMNLLASVAAGEISPANSPQGSTSVPDEMCGGYNGKSKTTIGDREISVQGENQLHDVEALKQHIKAGDSQVYDEGQVGQSRMPGKDADTCLRSSDGKPDEPTCLAGGEGPEQVHECKGPTPDIRQGVGSCLATKDEVSNVSLKDENQTSPAGTSIPSAGGIDAKNDAKDGLKSNSLTEQLPAVVMSSESSRNEKPVVPSCILNDLLPGQLNDPKEDNVDVGGVRVVDKRQEDLVLESGVNDQKIKANEDDLGVKEVANSPAPNAHAKEPCSDANGSNLATGEVEEAEQCASPAATSSSMTGKLEFDLNEGFDVDDGKDGEQATMASPGCLSSVRVITTLPSLPMVSTSLGLPASVTVAAAAKGAFVPPEDLLRNKGELGWKGSAATSAFRPAEPRKVPEVASGTNNNGRVRFEIDLNVADERILEDFGCQSSEAKTDKRDNYGTSSSLVGTSSMNFAGGLDLDLNRVDEMPELGQLASTSHRFEAPFLPAKLSSSSGLSNSGSARRDFDLNNGPAADEVTVESTSSYYHHERTNIPLQPSVGFRINNTTIRNLNSWYPPGSTFSAIPIPAPLSGREQPFPIVGPDGVPPRIWGGPTGPMPFNPDMYRGSVLSSSPAVPFPAGPFQYPVFPFGTSFPLPSSSLPGGSTAFMDLSSGGRLCIPAVPSQLVGTSPAIPSQYPRPYVVSLSDVSNSGSVDNARKWVRQGLDLNAGPGGPDVEGRDESLPIPPRPVSTMGSLALADEHSRMMYSMAGSVLKRKEPESGWDADRLGYKQP